MTGNHLDLILTMLFLYSIPVYIFDVDDENFYIVYITISYIFRGG